MQNAPIMTEPSEKYGSCDPLWMSSGARSVDPQFQYDQNIFSTKVRLSDEKSIAELLLNAETLLANGEKELGRVLVYEALKKNSKNILALKKAKELLDQPQDLRQQISIQRVICENEICFENFSEIAHLAYKLGEDEMALKYYQGSLDLALYPAKERNAGLFDVYKNMGNILSRFGDYDGAEENYNKAFTLNPESDALAVNLGTLCIQRNDYEGALEKYRFAIEKNPENDQAWVGLALVHYEMGDVQLAFANIENAIDLNPSNRTAVHLFTNWCSKEGKPQYAIEAVQNFLATVDVDEEMSLVLIHLFCKCNMFDLAKIESERVLLWKPSSKTMVEIQKELDK